MFVNYFKLAEQPFGSTPDPRFLFPTHSHREALASLQCSYLSNRGFMVLIAEPGMGKTTLLNEFLRQLRGRARTVFLFNTLHDPSEVVANILSDLGVVPGATEIERHKQLNEILMAEARVGRRLVLVIDEAQNLSHRVLEAVRMLTNFETANSKLMQVVLAGQPQLGDRLASPQAKQLRQRISTICHIKPLTVADTVAYISHRLKVSGWKKGNLFTASAVRSIAEASRGIPRNINTLCFNSLCLCYAKNTTLVDRATVEEAISDLQLSGDDAVRPLSTRSVPAMENNVAPNRISRYFSAWRVATYAASLVLVMVAVLAGINAYEMKVDARTTSVAQIGDHGIDSSHAVKVDAAKSANSGRQGKSPASAPLEIDSDKSHDSTANTASPIEVTISSGDTLESVVRTHLGTFNEGLLKQIQLLNPRIKDPDHIETGRTIRLPAGEQSNTDASKR